MRGKLKGIDIVTPGNVFAVRWRVPKGAQYSGGLSCSTVGGYHEVQWRVRSTVEGYLKYSGGCGVRWRAIISTVEGYMKYSGGLSCSTVEVASTVEGYLAVRWRAICSTVGGYHAVQWRVRSTVEGYHQYSGGCKYGGGLSCSTVEGASTVEGYLAVRWRAVIQYGGGCEVQWRAMKTRYTKHEMKPYKIYHD